jgi:hypothetical protein
MRDGISFNDRRNDAWERPVAARPRHQDLLRLSILAGHADAGLEAMRPDLVQVLLRVQTDLFAGAPAGARDTLQAYEALALALVPRAEKDTLLHVARRLRGLAHVPANVTAALAARAQALGIDIAVEAPPRQMQPENPPAHEVVARPVTPHAAVPGNAPAPVSSALDLALARDSHAMLGGRLLDDMVARARRNPELAEALLARTDLPARPLAPLYLHADASRRAILRSAMAQDGGAGRHLRLVRPTRERVASLHDAAESADKAAFGVRLAQGLGLAAVPEWRFEQPARQDCLALALLAMGAPEEASIRIFLTLDNALARDVARVFALVEIIRRTPRSVACALIEAIYETSIALPQRHAVPQAGALAMQASEAGRGLGLDRATGSERGIGAVARDSLRAGTFAPSDGRKAGFGSRNAGGRIARDRA